MTAPTAGGPALRVDREPPDRPDADLGRAWLVRLRWGVLAGQIVTVLFASIVLGFSMPEAAAALLIGLTALSNLVLRHLHRRAIDIGEDRVHPAVIPAAVCLDLVVLTATLALTGGASNPFSVLYLLHVALAAVLLGPAWTGAVTVLAVAGFGLLFVFTDPHAMHQGGEGAMQAHLWGMWLAFAVTGGGISWFVAQLARALRQRDAELTRLRRVAELQERVVSLATLAAGAAHELGSPLAAVAVSAREIELLAEPGSEIAEEARAQRAQIERCRTLIARLSQQAGAAQAEPGGVVRLSAVWHTVGASLPGRDAGRTRFEATDADLCVFTSERGLVEALGSLVQNALLAGPGDVRVYARKIPGAAGGDDGVELGVEDRGTGMPEAVLNHAGEPFFTTRRVGEGMGLGLFLARRYAESQGGRLEIRSAPGQGTTAVLWLPARST